MRRGLLGARGLLLAAVAGVTACTMIPHYERPAAPVAAAYPNAPAPQAGAAAAEIAWRDVFGDEQLKSLVELALANNRDLRTAVLKVEQLQAQYRVTRANSFPQVDANAAFARENIGPITTSQWTANVGITAYEIDLFGRVRSLNAQALEQYLATAEAQRSEQISLVASVATQYFTLRETQEQVKLARETLDAVQESYRLNKVSFDAGQINELDLRTAEGQVQNARINLLTYERALAQARNGLEVLLGAPLPSQLPAARDFDDPALVAQVPAGLPSDLVARRPDILEAEHTLKSANANVGAARAAFFPRITLTGSVGRSSTELSRLFDAGNGSWTFLPQLSVPLFAGGANRANLDVAKVEERIEVAQYEKAIQTAFREVADALVAASSYSTQVDIESAAIETQRRRYELADARYRQGDDTYLNVLSAQQDLYNAQQGRIQARFNGLASQIALYQALGGGWK